MICLDVEEAVKKKCKILIEVKINCLIIFVIFLTQMFQRRKIGVIRFVHRFPLRFGSLLRKGRGIDLLYR